ncbi:DUF4214 domain-containing protein [Hominifimenecus sp. rT4P-3]|uniref:DUF4214 domain-containing protein n=1 Tax=Hominifimenecus sp. rT4P-3 TaxID=3242979 RepID=UPI003DA24327
MINNDKRQALTDAVKNREGKNIYTQGSKRDKVDSGWSDCSSLVQWAYRKIGIEIGDNTEAQMQCKQLYNVAVPIDAGVPREADLMPGDLLYFRGRDTSRSATQYVGHVEMYVGNGQISGHGSGIGPTRKNMVNYCQQRQASSSPVPVGNRGLICVRRAAVLTEDDQQSDQDYVTDLYCDLLGREPDSSGLNGWVKQLLEGMSREEVRQGFLQSKEYQWKHPSEKLSEIVDTKLQTYVKEFQQWMNIYLAGRLREPLEIDGNCGAKTRKAAVMAMQVYLNKMCGARLAVDGSFGPKSRAAYETVRRGRKGDNVRIVQGLLYGHGYDPAGFDGSCGAGCERAIKQYQANMDSLVVDGHCGKATFTELVK